MSRQISVVIDGELTCPYCGESTTWKVEHQRSSRTIRPWGLEMTVTGSVNTSDGPSVCVELRIPCDYCGLFVREETTIPPIK